MPASLTRVAASLERADDAPAAHVFTLRLDDEARASARALDEGPRAGSQAAFFGAPITVKDNFDLVGHPTTAGSKFLAHATPAQRDAPVVTRLRQAGLVVLGRTNMTEFAFSGLGLNPHYGTPVNPAFPGERRIPGGSSSGAAVSVALGIASAAIGTDTGGSVRIPAALCGLTGFKPTADAVSRRGVVPLSPTLDAVGIIARRVADCTAVFDIIRDSPGQLRAAVSARRIRLGLVETYVVDDVSAEVDQAMRSAVAMLAGSGVQIERLAIPEFADIPTMMREATFAAAEAFAWHAPFLADHGDAYDPRVLVRIRAGETMTAAAYIRLIEGRRALIAAVAARMAGLDALIWPTVPFTAPLIDSMADDVAYHETNLLALRNSTIVNLIDGCAISIPCPGAGAPVGLSVAATRGRDDHLLAIAAVIESIFQGARHGRHQRT